MSELINRHSRGVFFFGALLGDRGLSFDPELLRFLQARSVPEAIVRRVWT